MGEIDGLFSSIGSFVSKGLSTIAKPALTLAGGALGTVIPIPGVGTAAGAALGNWAGSQLGGGGDSPAPATGTSSSRLTARTTPKRTRTVARRTRSRSLRGDMMMPPVRPPLTTGQKVAIAAGGMGALGAAFWAWHALR